VISDTAQGQQLVPAQLSLSSPLARLRPPLPEILRKNADTGPEPIHYYY
jgi:hypothetical protein